MCSNMQFVEEEWPLGFSIDTAGKNKNSVCVIQQAYKRLGQCLTEQEDRVGRRVLSATAHRLLLHETKLSSYFVLDVWCDSDREDRPIIMGLMDGWSHGVIE